MANNISYAAAYLKLLDEIYKKESCTAILETIPRRSLTAFAPCKDRRMLPRSESRRLHCQQLLGLCRNWLSFSYLLI